MILSTLAACLLVAPYQAADEETGRLIVTRHDLARLVLDIDKLVATGTLLEAADGVSALARTNYEFDRLTSLFFGAQLSEAARGLATLEDRLETLLVGRPLVGSKEVVSGLRFDPWSADTEDWTSRLHLEGERAQTARLRVRGMWARPELAGRSFPIRGQVHDHSDCFVGFGSSRWPVLGEIRFDALGRAVPTTIEIEVPDRVVRPLLAVTVGKGQNGLLEDKSLHTEFQYAEGLVTPPAERRRSFTERLEAIEAVEEGAYRAMRSRLAIRWDAPSLERSSEFLTYSFFYLDEIEADLAALERGEDPFFRRVGDHWRTFAHGRRDLAARVFLPDPAPEGPLPLVIALHGAGGDEGFLFELAGGGHIKRLAEQHGCLVVAPFTPDFLWSPRPFDALLAGIAEDYPIDEERVYVVGHSMGGMVTSRLCRERTDAIAAACCIAGFRPITSDGAPPVLVVQGERDSIVPARSVRRAVDASTATDVVYVELPDQGHTLLLPEALDLAFSEWFD